MSVGAGEAHILNLCVAAAFRCRGAGQAAARWACSSGPLRRVWARRSLKCGPPTPTRIRLYQSLGFEQVGMRRGYYQAVGGREDAAVLNLALRTAAAPPG